MGLWTRILARYFVGGMVGVLIYAGLPADMIDLVKNDPEVMAGVTVAIGAGVEGVTVLARRRGWLT